MKSVSKAPEMKYFNFRLKFLSNNRPVTFDPLDKRCATCWSFCQWSCVSVCCMCACAAWPSGLMADRGQPSGVTALAWLGASRPVCTVSCQALHIYKAVLLLVKQSGGGICIVVSLLVPFTCPAPLPSPHLTVPRSFWPCCFFNSWFRLISHFVSTSFPEVTNVTAAFTDVDALWNLSCSVLPQL